MTSSDGTEGQPIGSSSASSSSSSSNIPKDIASWLTLLGYKQYVDKFIAQEITVEVLPLLTESHLENQLGVTTLGARLKMLHSIREMRGIHNI